MATPSKNTWQLEISIYSLLRGNAVLSWQTPPQLRWPRQWPIWGMWGKHVFYCFFCFPLWYALDWLLWRATSRFDGWINMIKKNLVYFSILTYWNWQWKITHLISSTLYRIISSDTKFGFVVAMLNYHKVTHVCWYMLVHSKVKSMFTAKIYYMIPRKIHHVHIFPPVDLP